MRCLEVRLRESYNAAIRDRNTDQFYHELNEALRAKQLTFRDFSLRRMLEHLVPNGREMLATFQPGYRIQQDARELRESVEALGMSSFTKITGNIIYNHALDGWNKPELIGDELVTTMPSSLTQEEIPGVSNFGDIGDVVPEHGDFPMYGLSESSIKLPKPEKRGGQVALTKEIVFFDRLGQVVTRAHQLSEGLAINKEKRILDAVFGVTNTYTRNDVSENTYTASGVINTKTSNGMVDWKNVDAAEQLFSDMVDPDTGEPIVTTPNTLIVPLGLLHTAKQILNATEVMRNTPFPDGSSDNPDFVTRAPNTLRNYKIMSNQYVKARLGNSTTWFIGDPKRAFVYVENWPMIVDENPIGSSEWRRDIVAGWKVSERGAIGVYERRHMVKNTA